MAKRKRKSETETKYICPVCNGDRYMVELVEQHSKGYRLLFYQAACLGCNKRWIPDDLKQFVRRSKLEKERVSQ